MLRFIGRAVAGVVHPLRRRYTGGIIPPIRGSSDASDRPVGGCALARGGEGRWPYSRSSGNRRPWPRRLEFEDTGDRLPTPDEFEALAKTDPVKLLGVCLTRYQREVKGGITASSSSANG